MCLHINVLTRHLEVKWCALSEGLCLYDAPHTLLHKLYPYIMYYIVNVNTHEMCISLCIS